jgi:hypothetical protein
LEHLPIKLYGIDVDYKAWKYRNTYHTEIESTVDKICLDKNLIPIYLWGGEYKYKASWKDQIKTFNRRCQEKNLNLFIEEEDFGYINLPHRDIYVKPKSVYLENSKTLSGQTDFEFDIEKLSLMFPSINFYTTGKCLFSANNVIDSSSQDIIGLANISKRCDLIIGKGSGPFFCTLNYENKDKIKALFGIKSMWCENGFKFWEPDNDKILLCYTNDELFNLLRRLRDNKLYN